MTESELEDRRSTRREGTRRLIICVAFGAFIAVIAGLLWAHNHGQQSIETALATLFGALSTGLFGVFQHNTSSQGQQQQAGQTPVEPTAPASMPATQTCPTCGGTGTVPVGTPGTLGYPAGPLPPKTEEPPII